MKVLQYPIHCQISLMVAVAGVWGAGTAGLTQGAFGSSDPNQLLNPPIVKHYQLDCEYLSLDPNKPMESYKPHGSGMLGAGNTLGTFWRDNVRRFQTRITSQLKDKRFLVQVRITPYRTDTVTPARTIELDLSDLRARSVEIARNTDGRVYWINMTPSIKIIDSKAKRLRESALDLTSWNLNGSPVVVDDTTYIGNMGVSGGTIAYVETSAIGRIEFALVPYKGAELSGVLSNGHLQLRHQDRSLDIYGVQNGRPAMRLPGGPYKVWAKWSAPSANQQAQTQEIPSSAEEFIQLIRAQFAETGQTPPDDDTLRAGYERIKDMKLLPLSCGVRSIGKKERVED
ncbi:MAG: hypothetical protein IIA65_00280 [Planctomycetes bacterium]|nr:hypothetical protein [Planctomycetota bacterium]